MRLAMARSLYEQVMRTSNCMISSRRESDLGLDANAHKASDAVPRVSEHATHRCCTAKLCHHATPRRPLFVRRNVWIISRAPCGRQQRNRLLRRCMPALSLPNGQRLYPTSWMKPRNQRRRAPQRRGRRATRRVLSSREPPRGFHTRRDSQQGRSLQWDPHCSHLPPLPMPSPRK